MHRTVRTGRTVQPTTTTDKVDDRDGPGFIRASRLYDVDTSERFKFDWDKMQLLAESQAEIERAVAAAEQGQSQNRDPATPLMLGEPDR